MKEEDYLIPIDDKGNEYASVSYLYDEDGWVY